MPYATDPPDRKQNRLENKDYSRNGAYFITVCTKDRTEFFGRVHNGEMEPSEIGSYAIEAAALIETVYKSALLEAFVLMPNHVHMLIHLLHEHNNPTLHRILNQFKGAVSKKASFSLWQHRYHDHVICDAEEYRRIREYIHTNPLKWEDDCHNVNRPLAESL